ncbi:MAG TPA: TetR/AcrR family transcriptional regulator [Devosia sp.]|nr:TetR/AcrR family transcriptional regulator [Devosia sp.]
MRSKSPPTRQSADASRLRFLDATDRVFIREGYDGSTIRLITAEAHTSLARLNRHWTGKQHLFEEALARHFEPIHAAQAVRFDQVEQDGRAHDPGAVIEAFLSPALLGNIGQEEQRTSHLVYCRALTDPSPEISEIVGPLVQKTRARLIAMLREALPGLNEQMFFLAVATVLGAYVYPQIYGARLARAMGVDFQKIDWTSAGAMLATMLAEGLAGRS